jgi:hypothetical protein
MNKTYNNSMRHYFYKITNRNNDKFYFGVHSFKGDYNDSKYWGSGCFSKDARKNPEKYLREVIFETETREAALKFEEFFVTQAQVENPMCYNMQTGGRCGHGYITSDETKAKLRIANSGKTHSDETKARLSAIHKGKVLSAEHKKKIGVASKLRTHSDETKARMSAAQKGIQQPKIQCPHCQKIGGISIMNRWHFENCKEKI